MIQVIRCPECGVPEHFGDNHIWLNSGVIVPKGDLKHRMVFIESENIDPLYRSIEEIIGVPIEHIIIRAQGRSTRDYLRKWISRDFKDKVRERILPAESAIEMMESNERVLGYGSSTCLEVLYEGEEGGENFILVRLAEPYSFANWCGQMAGACEAITDYYHAIAYEEVGPDTYDVRAYVSEAPSELEDRALRQEYQHREGDIELELCPTCESPTALSQFEWILERGIIRDRTNARRMSISGDASLQSTFDELEDELGDTIPRTVVEAQRRFIRTGFYSTEGFGDEGMMRSYFALRGLGNLREAKVGKKGVSLRLDKAGVCLMIVGMIQGLFELAFGVDSHVEWELSEEGDLRVEVTPSA